MPKLLWESTKTFTNLKYQWITTYNNDYYKHVNTKT